MQLAKGFQPIKGKETRHPGINNFLFRTYHSLNRVPPCLGDAFACDMESTPRQADLVQMSSSQSVLE